MGFRETARENFSKRMFRTKLQKMLRRTEDVDHRGVLKEILANDDLVEAAFYACLAELEEMPDVEGVVGEGKFPLLEKLLDAFLEDPEKWIAILELIISLFLKM